MGYTSYSINDRQVRSQNLGYFTKSRDDLFEQNKKATIHESLNPTGLRKRECFDSPQHPNTIAVIVGLDVTGSMGHIPHMLMQNGLPTMMGTIVEKGSPDVAVCFVAVGDHRSDRAPLQVGQFESGDEELDIHLKNTWLESGGGGNGGESYPLVWYFAAHHTSIDCWNKRNQKGLIITVGDEDFHKSYDASSIRRIFGDTAAVEGTVSASQLLEDAQKHYEVYHLGLRSYHNMSAWREILGDHFIDCENYTDIPTKVAEIVLEYSQKYSTQHASEFSVDEPIDAPSTPSTPLIDDDTVL